MGRMYYLPMLLLLAVGLAGCQKGEKEVEYPPITPSLPPKGSVIGEWERVWESGFMEEPSTRRAPRITMVLNPDSTWSYTQGGRTQTGAKFTNRFRPMDPELGSSSDHYVLSLLEKGDKNSSVILHYVFLDTCLIENGSLKGAVGGKSYFWYLKRR